MIFLMLLSNVLKEKYCKSYLPGILEKTESPFFYRIQLVDNSLFNLRLKFEYVPSNREVPKVTEADYLSRLFN